MKMIISPLFKKHGILNSGVKVVGIRCFRERKPEPPKPFIPVNRAPNDHLPFKIATIDDIPAPHGDWLEDYKKRQIKHWRDLFLGLTFFGLTMAYMYYYEPLFFNAFPPEMPPKDKRLTTFWDGDEEEEDDDDDDDEDEE